MFEEDEERMGITSDVVEVDGEDSDTPDYVRGDRVRRDVCNFQSWVRPPWIKQIFLKKNTSCPFLAAKIAILQPQRDTLFFWGKLSG